MKASNFLTVSMLSISICFSQVSGVGINELSPEQMLHLGSANGTIRVDGLNENNSSFNEGGTQTYPLYADYQGNLTLENQTLYNNNGNDAFTSANMTTTDVVLPSGDADGIQNEELYSFTITVNRSALLLIKYNLSFEVFGNSALDRLTDKSARRVSTYFRLNSSTRKYSHTSKCYTSSNKQDVNGILYNMSSSYIIIPAAGTYTITLHGEVSSGLTSSLANTSKPTMVRFGTGMDTLMYKLN